MENKLILGAICGDIVGSLFEFSPIKSKDFEFINDKSVYTDDTVMTVANMLWLIDIKNRNLTKEEEKECLIDCMHKLGQRDLLVGYGGRFYKWLVNEEREPYNSWGNGSAMRVSPIGWFFDNIEDVMEYAKISAEVTHNHQEGIKGAQAIASAIFLARNGKSKMEIKEFIGEV